MSEVVLPLPNTDLLQQVEDYQYLEEVEVEVEVEDIQL
jgi:hypothetical protein